MIFYLVELICWVRSCESSSSIMTIADSGFMMENGASCLPHTPEEEKRIIDELARKSEANVKEGNLFYVVSNRSFSFLIEFTAKVLSLHGLPSL